LCDLELSLTNERQNLRGLLKSVVVGWLLQPIRLLPKYFYHYFLFCQNFEKLLIIYAEIVIKPKTIIVRVRIPDLHGQGLTAEASLDTLDSSITQNNTVFIIVYNHYLLKISELKNQVPKLRFKI